MLSYVLLCGGLQGSPVYLCSCGQPQVIASSRTLSERVVRELLRDPELQSLLDAFEDLSLILCCLLQELWHVSELSKEKAGTLDCYFLFYL